MALLPLRYRLMEWFADGSRRVQYPPLYPADATFRGFRFAHPMPWWMRISLFLLSLTAVIFTLALLAVLGVVSYALIRAGWARV